MAIPIFVGGTSSHAGKSWMATAICAWLRRRGVRVAPFKSQNMSNNSYPCLGGGEIGRAQVAQAFACGLEPEPAMNPILLKPNADAECQVVVNGELWRTLSAREYYAQFPWLWQKAVAAYQFLAQRFDVIVIEGAGSIAELNFRDKDLVNLRFAKEVEARALLVADISRGGVFASVSGSVALLEPDERALLRAFAVNQFRGDRSLFDDGRLMLEERTCLPCLGVFPYAPQIQLEEEDGMSIPDAHVQREARVAILQFPRISNTTDFRLLREAAWVRQPVAQQFEVIFLPGTKHTMGDLAWLRQQGLEPWLREQHRNGAKLVGICGGYQMLGRIIRDPHAMESAVPEMAGLGYLPLDTELAPAKTVRRVQAQTPGGTPFPAYEIHLGESRALTPALPCFHTMPGAHPEGMHQDGVYGSYLHGATESPSVLRELFGIHVSAPGSAETYEALADWFEADAPRFTELFLPELRS